MTQINWGLSQGPNAFDTAFGTGIQLGQAARRQQGENALAAYAVDPNEKNFATVAKYQPRFAMQERERQSEAQRQQQFVELRRKALAGDQQAQTELAAQDNAAYNAMSKQQRDQVDAQDDALANAAFQIIQAPPEQRAAIWDEQARNLGADQYVGQYSDAMMNTIVNRAGIQERLQKFQRPDINFVPADAQAYAGNQAGENVLQAMGRTGGALPPPPPGFVIDEGGPASAPGNFPQ